MLRPLACVALALALFSPVAHAQFVARPWLDWRTVRTAHFDVHYPAQYREWTQSVISRLESTRIAVEEVVGYAPEERVQVLVDDPTNAANGFALPFIERPTMVFFPVPPTPRQSIGNSRDWGELLAVHEFAHLAHLARPSRRPADLWRLLPVQVGPIARGVPRWVTEGFATFVEGRVTGSGRPNNVQRAAVLRQWALEGRLPTYGQLSGSDAYNGGAFAYLGGSAYLEWLAEREGDSTITHLWRRMTARTRRSFPEAFTGVYGRAPDALYGRFTAEVTGRALDVEERVDSLGGIVAGELVQRLAWETGDPAVSPDGKRVAVVLRSATRPGRVVIWSTQPDSVPPRIAAERITARERARLADPLDVPDREFFPPARRVLAELGPRDGRAFDTPRFMPDGRHVLVTHAEPIGGGAFRPDLYIWDTETGDTRRVTRGAAVRQPDPSPDGRTAVAVRCARGWCDLGRVDLSTGSVSTLRAGSPQVSYFRPRRSPHGDRIAVAEQRDDQWRIIIVDADDPSRTDVVLPGDRATRFDVAWADSATLLAVSEASGIANIERIDLATRTARPITRVTGAAYAPEIEPGTGAVWFLSLHSRGLDVHRLPPDAAPVALPDLDQSLFPAAPPDGPRTAAPLAVDTSFAERPYRLGPRATRWLPGITRDAGALSAQLLLINGDPVGRLELALVGAFGSGEAWRGARAWATVRRWCPFITAEAFGARQQPFEIAGTRASATDVRVLGGGVRTVGHLDRSAWRAAGALGAAAMLVDGAGAASPDARRGVAWGNLEISGSRRLLGSDLGSMLRVGADVGRHGSTYIRHYVVTGAARADLPVLPPIQVALTRARNASDDDAAPFEQLAVGGAASPLLDPMLLPQRLPMPALPAGTLVGSAATVVRGDLLLGALAPYFWTARVSGDEFGGWNRVLGAEVRFSTTAYPLVTLPRVDIVGGVGYSIDEPFRKRTTAYMSMAYRP